MLDVKIASEAEGLVRLAMMHIANISVGPAPEQFWSDNEPFFAWVQETYGSTPPSQIPGVDVVRAMYKATGIDPTRYRPSCEALIRRVAAGKPLYRVNIIVDLLNAHSLRRMVPACAHDLARMISGPLTVRLGKEGEEYEGIEGKKMIPLHNRIVLADANGPFGNPSADSDRTKISSSTSAALLVLYVPPCRSNAWCSTALAHLAADITRWCGGTVIGTTIVPASAETSATGAENTPSPGDLFSLPIHGESANLPENENAR